MQEQAWGRHSRLNSSHSSFYFSLTSVSLSSEIGSTLHITGMEIAGDSFSIATDMSCGPFTARPNSTERQPTGLCTHCQVLQLHDIDPDQISASQKYYLKYERHDSIPGLPLIGQSAAAGCGVCRMLHTEIIDALAHLDEPGPVKICRVVVEFYENQMAFEIESPCGTTRVSFFTAADSGWLPVALDPVLSVDS